MYLAGVSVRRVEDITEALWGTRVSPATVSDLKEDLRDDRGVAQPERMRLSAHEAKTVRERQIPTTTPPAPTTEQLILIGRSSS